MNQIHAFVSICLISSFAVSCASGPAVKDHKYAKLKSHRTYEYDFSSVWKSIEEVVRGYKVTERDPDELNEVELRKTTERTLETGWIYSKSNDKFHSFKVDGKVKKVYLQTRLRYKIKAETVLGGTKVTIRMSEEVEKLDNRGQPNGYEEAGSLDSGRIDELLNKVETQLTSAS